MKHFLTFIIFLFIGFESVGQTVYNPNIIPLGDKEPLMANTGTGGLASTGAVYYNPAALTMLKGSSFSLSGNAYMRYEFTAEPIAEIYGNDLNFDAKGFQTIPTSAIMVRKVKDWHVALSFLVPMEFQYEGQKNWNLNLGFSSFDFKLLQNYKEKMFMAGLSGARKLNNRWSLGISIFGQQYTYLENIQLVSSSPLFGLLSDQTSRKRYAPFSLLPILGIHRNGDKWNMGFKLSLPSIYLFGKGDYYSFSYESDSGSNPVIESLDLKEVKANFKSPIELRFGTTYLVGKRWNFALDASVNAPVSFDIYPDSRIAQEQNITWSYRISSASEYKAFEKISFHLGTSYTPSTLENAEENGGLDFMSLFLGGKLKSEHVETSVGLFSSYAEGFSELENSTQKTTQTYRYLGLFLGTNYKF